MSPRTLALGAAAVLAACATSAASRAERAERSAESAPTIALDPADHRCGRCHAPTLLAARAAVFPHAPARDGECEGCHEPHAPGGGPAAIRADACFDCHDLRDAAHAHMRYAIPPSRCRRCHEPHGARAVHLLAAKPHDALSDCNACHVPPESRDPFDRVSPEPDLCLACHDRPHGGEARPACTTCHDPHFPVRAAPGRRG